MVEKFEPRFDFNDIPIYIDRLSQDSNILVLREKGKIKSIIVTPDIYEKLKWNEFDINDKRYEILKEIFG